MWDEWKYGYLSKLKLHFIHAGKADTRESAFRLGVAHVERARELLRNNGRPIMCIIPTSCGVSFRVQLFLAETLRQQTLIGHCIAFSQPWTLLCLVRGGESRCANRVEKLEITRQTRWNQRFDAFIEENDRANCVSSLGLPRAISFFPLWRYFLCSCGKSFGCNWFFE